MKIHLISLYDRLLLSFWFVPWGMSCVMAALAVLLPLVDARLDFDPLAILFGLEMTPSSVQAMLTTIVTAGVSIAGIVFSLTILTLSIAASQLGPRLLRTFLADIATQFSLGLYISTSIYCLMLLSLVNEDGAASFVPHFAVLFALAMALFGLVFLVVFIHRIAQLIQAPNVVESVARDLDRAIERLFPHPLEGTSQALPSPEAPLAETCTPVHARGEGYLQGLDTEALVALAMTHSVVLRLLHRPGQYVVRGAAIAEVYPPGAALEEIEAGIDQASIYGNRRTPRQDVECTILELAEVAVRALSPGTNDPFTALNCTDRLGGALSRLVARQAPSPYHRDDKGALRVILREESFASALDAAFEQIRQYGRESVAILIRILESLRIIAACAHRPEDRAAIARHGDMVLRTMERNIDEENDRADVEARYTRLCQVLDSREAD